VGQEVHEVQTPPGPVKIPKTFFVGVLTTLDKSRTTYLWTSSKASNPLPVCSQATGGKKFISGRFVGLDPTSTIPKVGSKLPARSGALENSIVGPFTPIKHWRWSGVDLIETPDSPFYDHQLALATIEETIEHAKGPLCEMFTVDAKALLEIAEVAFGILRHGEYCACEAPLLEHAFAEFTSGVLPI
jgi:hypothetical protein